MEKLQESGGHVSINIQFHTTKKSEQPLPSTTNNNNKITTSTITTTTTTTSSSSTSQYVRSHLFKQDDYEFTLPPLKSGAGTLAKFLSLVEDDSLDDLTNRVGDLAFPNTNSSRRNLSNLSNPSRISSSDINKVDKSLSKLSKTVPDITNSDNNYKYNDEWMVPEKHVTTPKVEYGKLMMNN